MNEVVRSSVSTSKANKLKIVVTIVLMLISTWAPGQRKYVDLGGMWKFSIGDKVTWRDPDFDDTQWEEIFVPGPWEEQGFHGYDGYAWYRTTFDGRDLPKNTSLFLKLGYIDDADEVFLNGQMIGFSGSFPPKFNTAYRALRNYEIPPDVINFNGKNTLAVRVFDVTNEGGIIKERPGIYGRDDNAAIQINLEGIWQFQTGKKIDDDRWENVMVPIPWESQGHRKYDGIAWYSRSFEMPDDLYGEDLVLIGGKIDDFDAIYINGQKIGETNDHRPFGSSRSFDVLRVYTIPSNVLWRGKNTITVMVEDIGNIGGIYEGPVGITTRELYNRHFRR